MAKASPTGQDLLNETLSTFTAALSAAVNPTKSHAKHEQVVTAPDGTQTGTAFLRNASNQSVTRFSDTDPGRRRADDRSHGSGE